MHSLQTNENSNVRIKKFKRIFSCIIFSLSENLEFELKTKSTLDYLDYRDGQFAGVPRPAVVTRAGKSSHLIRAHTTVCARVVGVAVVAERVENR